MKAKQHGSIKKQSIATAPTRSLRPPRAFDIWKPRPLPQIMEIDEKSPSWSDAGGREQGGRRGARMGGDLGGKPGPRTSTYSRGIHP